MPTIPQIVSSYPIAEYLSAIDIPKKGLYGGGTNILLPQKIANIGRAVSRIFNYDPSDSTLPLTANFLWSLEGIYGQAALSVEQESGTISPVTPINPGSGSYYVLNATVISTDPDDGSPTIGSFVYQSDLMIGATQLQFIFVNSMMETIASGAFTFDSDTGTITRINTWQSGDTVQIPFVMA